MKAPNAELAAVDREKIVGYLLNAMHPDNGGKSAFFHAVGLDQDAEPAVPNLDKSGQAPIFLYATVTGRGLRDDEAEQRSKKERHD